MTNQELLDNGWKEELCKIGTLYFKDGFFCRFKDNETLLVFHCSDDMNPLGEAKTLDDIFELKKQYFKYSVQHEKLKYEIAKDYYEIVYKEKYGNPLEMSFIWSEAEEAPSDVLEPVLYMTTNNKLGVFKNTEKANNTGVSGWTRLKEKYNVKFWAYQKDIIVD